MTTDLPMGPLGLNGPCHLVERRTFLREWLKQVEEEQAKLRRDVDQATMADSDGRSPMFDLNVLTRWRAAYRRIWELQRDRELILKEIEAAPPTKAEILEAI